MFPFRLNSRIHTLPSFGSDWYVKRDDELSCTISGSKIRKFASLLPWILSQKQDFVSLIGGHNSNNVLGLTQLLIENGIFPHAYVREAYGASNKNLLQKLLPQEHIHVVPRKEWPPCDVPGLVIPEGACMQEALPGAESLGHELEEEGFDHIFIDAGTGMQALGLLSTNVSAHVHILLLAGDKEHFERKVKEFAPDTTTEYSLYFPSTARSFGSCNATLNEYVVAFPKRTGFFIEPVYSGKLFYEAERLGKELSGRKCIVHSGGVTSQLHKL